MSKLWVPWLRSRGTEWPPQQNHSCTTRYLFGWWLSHTHSSESDRHWVYRCRLRYHNTPNITLWTTHIPSTTSYWQPWHGRGPTQSEYQWLIFVGRESSSCSSFFCCSRGWEQHWTWHKGTDCYCQFRTRFSPLIAARIPLAGGDCSKLFPVQITARVNNIFGQSGQERQWLIWRFWLVICFNINLHWYMCIQDQFNLSFALQMKIFCIVQVMCFIHVCFLLYCVCYGT